MTASQRTFCNPLDIAYRYQDIRFSGTVGGTRLGEPWRSVHREAADPSIVRYRDRYDMFVSMSAGFWHSTDLLRWEYRATAELPVYASVLHRASSCGGGGRRLWGPPRPVERHP